MQLLLILLIVLVLWGVSALISSMETQELEQDPDMPHHAH
ncbi:hypothetical protein GCM10008938_43770 [Deinococcus roseus]|uniref:Methionine/alanine importer small subunit n=1 Tax=Deinococcus roseus TaxID=392414 RepID=A0ABQ2DER5_9DEIO|nr:hypothetical protein GCM10008938_43770 [Deinococcus roseus]